RGSSSRASNRSSDTNRNTRIPAPKSSSQQSSSSSRRPSSRMTINMTTTITTSGSHSGLIVQSGVASAPSPSHSQRQPDPWSLPSVSSPLPSLPAASPLAVAAAPAAPAIEEIPGTTSEEIYAPSSHHSEREAEMPRLAQESAYDARPSSYQPQRFEEAEREQEEVSYVDPRDVLLNTFSTNPPPVPAERLSRRDLPMRPDTTSTTTYMEIFREPGEPLHAYQRLALPPHQKPDLLYGPRYEQWSNTRTETLIDDRGGKAVQWKPELVETDDEMPMSVQTKGREASTSPSYVRARSRETRQDTKDGRVIKESVSDEDITIETRSGPLSPRLFSPSSASATSPHIGSGALPAPPRIGWGAAPTPVPIITSPSIGSGARPLSPVSVDTRYGGGTRPASRALSPDDYHEALRRDVRSRTARSPSPLRRTTASSMYTTTPGYAPSTYSRPPPSYRTDSRYGSPVPPPGSLDRSKSSEDPDSSRLSEQLLSTSFSYHAEGPAAEVNQQQDVAASVESESPLYAPTLHQSPVYAATPKKSEAVNTPTLQQDAIAATEIDSPCYAATHQQQPTTSPPESPLYAPTLQQSAAASVAEHSPIYREIMRPPASDAEREKPIYAATLQQDAADAANSTSSPIYAATRQHAASAASQESLVYATTIQSFPASESPIYSSTLQRPAAKESPVYAAPQIRPVDVQLAATAAMEDYGLRLSQLSPRRDSMTQTEEMEQLLQKPPTPPPRPPPPTLARPMHRTSSYRQSLPPSARLDEHVYDQIPLERQDTRRHSFTCPPAFISRRSLEKIVHCLNEFPKSRRRSNEFAQPTAHPATTLERSQSVGGNLYRRHLQSHRGPIRIPVERRPSEDAYESAENRRPVRVTIDYDPRYAKVVKPSRPPPPRKPLSSTATFAPSSRSIRERSPSKIVRIINGRSYSVDGGRRGRHRPMSGTSPTPPNPSAAPTPPSIASLPSSRPSSALLDLPSRAEERRGLPPLANERVEERQWREEDRGRERSKP
ncbi:hypothetical protein PMAYCL1PPCAC_23046, partial [Pristionchus mayeri]